MDFLTLFKEHLVSQKKKISASTIKNYLADVRHFILWYEQCFHGSFNPQEVGYQTWERFKEEKADIISSTSLQRHFFSVKKFFSFLVEKKVIDGSPFDQSISKPIIVCDPWEITSFKEDLYREKASKLTIKNYIIDVQKFSDWLEQVIGMKNLSAEDKLLFLNLRSLEEYKKRLIEEKVFSPRSINRKLSSIRKYLSWVKRRQENYDQNLHKYISKDINNNQKLFRFLKKESFIFGEFLSRPFVKRREKTFVRPSRGYSKLPPLRLLQKLLQPINLITDSFISTGILKLLEKLDYALWSLRGKPIFFQKQDQKAIHSTNSVQEPELHHIPKALYAPFAISVDNFPFHKKLYHHLRHTRPKWYKSYHNYAVSEYFHLAILIIFMSAIGFSFYDIFFLDARSNKSAFASLAIGPPRLLSFQGKLTDKQNNPIIATSNVRFAIYNSPHATGSALIWQEVNSVHADRDGTISVVLGNKNALVPDIFSQHNTLWLGISVETTPELSPRQQLTTVAYAAKAATLQGLSPITDDTAGTKNVVLALDSSGNLTIGGNEDHTFQATGGQFTLSGQTLVLSTTPGSSTDVVISPDGFGQIDLQKPLHNSGVFSNIPSAIGSVEVDDTFAILATSSGQSAFTINQTDIGPLISASASGVPKFTIENDGSIISAGNLSVAGKVASNLIPFASNLTLGSNTNQWDSVYAKSFFQNGRPFTASWQETPDSIVPFDVTKNLVVGGSGTTSATFQVLAKNGDLLTKGNLNLIGSSSAISTINQQTLTLGGSTTGAVSLSPNGNTGVFVNNMGSVGIGTVALIDQSALQVQKNSLGNALIVANQQGLGDIFTASASGTTKFTIGSTGDTKVLGASLCVKANNTNCVGNSAGTIYATNTTVQSADVAENYVSSQQLEPGDIIGAENGTNTSAINKSNKSYQSDIIGIISTKPGVTLNSDLQTDSDHPFIFPVALNGRVPVKVSTENGNIHKGDLLTSSSQPGIAMKATKPGPIIGKALENFNQQTVGKIVAFVTISWADPGVYLTDSGNVNIAPQLEKSAGSQEKNTKFVLEDSLGNTLKQIGNFSDSIIANLQAGIITANQIASDTISSLVANIDIANIGNLQVKNKILSPIAAIDEIHTNVISPLSNNSEIALSLDEDRVTVHETNQATGAAVATIDNHGNASFSGTLNSKSLEVAENASISGVLRASKIIAEHIEGLPQSTTSAEYITKVTNIYNATPSANETALNNRTENIDNTNASSSGLFTNSTINTNDKNYANIASLSGFFSYVPSLQVNTATFEQGLMSLGPTSLSDTSITGQLSIGSSFILTNNAINVLNGDLELQPLRQGGIAIAGRQIYIDSNGNVTFNGNATVNGTLAANIISPIPNHDLVINLASNQELNSSEIHHSSFIIHNSSSSAVFAVNQLGDIMSSGAATINKLNLINPQPALALSDNEMLATGSAGIATISAHQTQVTIDNPLVTEKSLIYISPVGNSSFQTPFLLKQVPNESFTVGIQQPSFTQTMFNWLIVN